MRAVIAIVCLTSVSCTSPYPNAIPDPENDDSIRLEYNKYTSKAENRYLMAANQVKIYELQLWQKEKRLATQKYSLSDISAVGAVTSVIAAASGALTTALYAGGVSVVGGAVGQRYNYDVQLLNYRTTRQKLNCIYRSMTDISTQQLAIAINDENKPSVIGILKPYLNSIMSDLIFELESEQAAVNLVAPDLNSIADTFKERDSAKKHIESYQPGFFGNNSDSVLNLAELIRTNIKICKSSPSTAPVAAILAANTSPPHVPQGKSNADSEGNNK